MATFVNTSGHHRNTFPWSHLHFASPPLAMVASRVTFAGINNEAHGRVSKNGLVSGHGCVSGHGRISRLHYGCMSCLRPWSRLRLGAFAFTLIAFGFSIFFPLLFCLNMNLNNFFFLILWLLGFIAVVQRVYMFHVLPLTILFSLLLKLRKSIFYCLHICYVWENYFFNC